MLPFVTAAMSFVDRLFNRKKGESAKELKSLIKNRLESGDPVILRDPEHYFSDQRAANAPSTAFESGHIAQSGDNPPVRWKQYRWTNPKTLGESSWQSITWRFYENNLIAFQAEMANASTGLDQGDTQGHRIELVTNDGWMVGAWRAEFFVRRNNAVRHFAGYFEENHHLLSLHFDELAEVQMGIWFHGGRQSSGGKAS